MWVLYPELRRADIFRVDGTFATFKSDGAFGGEDVLPGFTMSMQTLFESMK